jgi:hypothetical protein
MRLHQRVPISGNPEHEIVSDPLAACLGGRKLGVDPGADVVNVALAATRLRDSPLEFGSGLGDAPLPHGFAPLAQHASLGVRDFLRVAWAQLVVGDFARGRDHLLASTAHRFIRSSEVVMLLAQLVSQALGPLRELAELRGDLVVSCFAQVLQIGRGDLGRVLGTQAL